MPLWLSRPRRIRTDLQDGAGRAPGAPGAAQAPPGQEAPGEITQRQSQSCGQQGEPKPGQVPSAFLSVRIVCLALLAAVKGTTILQLQTTKMKSGSSQATPIRAAIAGK